jgi:hypothetical protein
VLEEIYKNACRGTMSYSGKKKLPIYSKIDKFVIFSNIEAVDISQLLPHVTDELGKHMIQ